MPCWHQEPAAVRTPQINHDQLSIAKKLDGQGQTWCVCWKRRGGVVQVQVFMLHTVRLQLLNKIVILYHTIGMSVSFVV